MVWQAPKKGWLKINCDGSYVEKGGYLGMGIMVRNVDGRIRVISTVPVSGVPAGTDRFAP